MLTRLPLVYQPAGGLRPDWAPGGGLAVMPGTGPDARRDRDGKPLDAGGFCHGGALSLARAPWTPGPAMPGTQPGEAPPAWWVQIDGHTPTHLRRVPAHPGVVRWRRCAGVELDHVWTVPVLLTRDAATDDWISALDLRLATDGTWTTPPDLAPLIEPLLALALGVPVADTPEDRTRTLLDLAMDLLALGHHGDRELWASVSWISQRLQLDVLRCAMNVDPVAVARDDANLLGVGAAA